jgi:hypothetical protein
MGWLVPHFIDVKTEAKACWMHWVTELASGRAAVLVWDLQVALAKRDSHMQKIYSVCLWMQTGWGCTGDLGEPQTTKVCHCGRKERLDKIPRLLCSSRSFLARLVGSPSAWAFLNIPVPRPCLRAARLSGSQVPSKRSVKRPFHWCHSWGPNSKTFCQSEYVPPLCHRELCNPHTIRKYKSLHGVHFCW